MKGFTRAHLDKRIFFSDREWSGMGFLWAIYGHRNYHLGNIDLLGRLAGEDVPDYFGFEPAFLG